MCGRFALALQADEVEQLDGYPALHVNQWVNRDRYVPRYNVAPRTHAPVIRRAQPEEPALVMHSMKWGLVPHWSKAEPPTLNTINARAENLQEGGGMWGSVKGRKRCVVVAQGYYEWLKKGSQRTPHFTRHKDQRLMLFAGLYDSVTLEGQSEPLWTFTIVTTEASSSYAWLHDRQPVILTSQDSLDRWLDTSTQTWDSKLNRLLGPYNDSDTPLECYAVPREVGKVGVQSPTFIEPVQKRKDGIEAMFSRQTKTAQQQTSASRDAPPAAAAAGSGKRKRESSSPTEEKEEEKETGTSVSTTAPSSPAKRSKVKEEDPIKHDDAINLEEEGNSDVEILPSGPSSSQSQSVGHPHFTMHEMTPIFFVSGPTFRKRRMKHVDRMLPSRRRRKRKMMTSLLLPHRRVRSSRSSSSGK
ncbi:hypothetical protein BGY98DRAFT_917654 [Russula aff. rugulosa BPL654]|nr:hypothetical protein BGY98DRAFT_917654 [Russula aff. rugulosa BPL654]